MRYITKGITVQREGDRRLRYRFYDHDHISKLYDHDLETDETRVSKATGSRRIVTGLCEESLVFLRAVSAMLSDVNSTCQLYGTLLCALCKLMS